MSDVILKYEKLLLDATAINAVMRVLATTGRPVIFTVRDMQANQLIRAELASLYATHSAEMQPAPEDKADAIHAPVSPATSAAMDAMQAALDAPQFKQAAE